MSTRDSEVTRRQFAAITGGALASIWFSAACDALGNTTQSNGGRLTARPRAGVKTTRAGTTPIGLGNDRDGIVRMPANGGDGPLPLLVLFHGAGGSGAAMTKRLGAAPDEGGVVILAPDSRGSTWDAIRGDFGPDVAFTNRALERLFGEVAIDPARMAIGGFSDGASYGVSLGLIDGDLFPRVAAFSPGFVVPGPINGRAKFFISHGRSDTILPIERCGRVIAADLKRQGYDVQFNEFEGGHEVPPGIAADAMRWIAAK